MTTNQPPTLEERLTRLENVFSNMGETILAQNETIDVLVANIQQLTENVAAVNQRVDSIAAHVDLLAEEAAQDRQQAAIDRQRFDRRIDQIFEYLRDRNGGSPPPQAN